MTGTKFETKPLFTRQQLTALLLPLIAEQALSVTIGLADTLMVSSVGEAAVSGVSLVDTFNTLMIQIMTALATGGAVVASQYIGHREEKSARCRRTDHVHHVQLQRSCGSGGRGGTPRHPAGHLRLHRRRRDEVRRDVFPAVGPELPFHRPV